MNAREWSLRIADLLRRERASVVDVLLALAEFDRLALYRQLGHASLFDFLHKELGLSRGMAHYRLVATRLVEQFPEVVEPLRDGRLCMSSVIELAKVITEVNRADVLPKFFDKSRAGGEAGGGGDSGRRRWCRVRTVVTRRVEPVQPLNWG